VSLTHSPANPTTADTITFVATVQNIGNATAGPSVLQFQVGGETYPPTYNVPSLAPGASCQVTRTLQLTVAQNYQNTATADYTNVVAESNETNNVTIDLYRVSAAPYPDLRAGLFDDDSVRPQGRETRCSLLWVSKILNAD
jgi:subtilase family serine protease